MALRETTLADIEFVIEHSVSRGCFKDQPPVTDFVYTLDYEDEVCWEGQALTWENEVIASVFILGIGGLKLINKTTAWAWVDITDRAAKYMTAGYRVIKEFMDKLADSQGLRHLQAYIEVDFPEAIRMAEHLGFRRECRMRQFTGENGEKDAYLYVRILERAD